MAELIICNGKDKYKNEDALDREVSYILNNTKTPNHCIGGSGVDMKCAAESMKQVRRKFNKVGKTQLRHSIITFDKNEATNPHMVKRIADKISFEIGKTYQNVYAVHENTENLHIHLVMNTVSHIDGHRYYGSRREFHNDLCMMQNVVQEFNVPYLYYTK